VSIFVGNLPFRAEKEDVSELFAPFGEVVSCALPLERDTGRKRGFAFVEMADDDAETRAIEGLQGAELMGRPLRINKAEPRSGRGGGGGYGGVSAGLAPAAGKTEAVVMVVMPSVPVAPAGVARAVVTRAFSSGPRRRPSRPCRVALSSPARPVARQPVPAPRGLPGDRWQLD
jgi:RNA recognition motif-containing protein